MIINNNQPGSPEDVSSQLNVMSSQPRLAELNELATLFSHSRFDVMAQKARGLIERYPDCGEAWKALGVATGASGGDALPALVKAVELLPGDEDVWRNLEYACRLASGSPAAEVAWGMVWRHDQGNLDAARYLINLVPREGRKRVGLARQLASAVLAHSPLPNEWLFASYVLRVTCDWESVAAAERRVIEYLRGDRHTAGWPVPFNLLSVPVATPLDLLRCASGFSERFAVEGIPLYSSVKRMPSTPGKIRIGYLSNDFHAHATAFLITEVIERHDRSRFEVFAYDHSPPRESVHRNRLLAAFDYVVAVHDFDNDALARRIAEDGIDIAIDLKGWTAGSRTPVLAMRPAPVQMQWLGFPGTLGAPWIDYLVADPVLVRPGEEGFYSEKVIFLPDTYQPNDRQRVMATAPTRKQAGLPEGVLVLACFNQPYKITQPVFECWMEVLCALPQVVLWLLDDNPVASAQLRTEALRQGVASDRLLFAPRQKQDQHLARLSLADLAIDCTPVGSHTTASDALWAGVPLVALSGATFASRVAESLLNAVGLPELVTDNLEDYRCLIIDLVKRPEKLAATRAKLAEQRLIAPLFDSKRFVRHLEVGLTKAWSRHVAGLLPDHIRVVEQIGGRGCIPTLLDQQFKVFQVFYDESSNKARDPGFHPLDNSDNLRPDWFELWPIRRYLMENELADDVWYGFLSTKFGQKTGYTADQVRDALNAASGDDVVIFSSAYGQSAYFKNVFEQGEFHHPGLITVSQRFFDAAGIDFDISSYVSHSANSVFSNFVIAKAAFWKSWLRLANLLFQFAESPELGMADLLNAPTKYGKNAEIAFKVFIQERLASVVLRDSSWRITPVAMCENVRRERAQGNDEAHRLLDQCDALKRAYCNSGETKCLDEFFKIRNRVSINSGSGLTEHTPSVFVATEAGDRFAASSLLKNG